MLTLKIIIALGAALYTGLITYGVVRSLLDWAVKS